LKFTDLKVKITLNTCKYLVDEVSVSIDSDNGLVYKYINMNVETSEFDVDFFDNFSEIPFKIRNFIAYFKNYRENLIRREGQKFLISATPIDFHLIENAMEFNTVFDIKNSKHRVSFNPQSAILRLHFDPKTSRLEFQETNKAFLLRANSGNFVVIDNEIRPLISPFSSELLTRLFREGFVEIDNDFKIKLLAKKQSDEQALEKFIDLPDIEKFENLRIVLYFENNSTHYSLKSYIRGGSEPSVYETPLIFPEIRKRIMLSEEILLSFENGKYHILKPSDRFYNKLKTVVITAYTEFFEFLREIDSNIIKTTDNENLFLKFLPKVKDFVEIINDSREVEFVHENFSEKNIEVVYPELPENLACNYPYYHIDWLEFKFHFKIRDIALSIRELKEILSEGFTIKDNNIISTTNEELSLLRELFDEVKFKEIHLPKQDDKFLVSRYNIPFLLKKEINLQLPEGLKDLPLLLSSQKAIKKVDLPDGIGTVLRNYQKVGVYWLHFLYRFGFGGILTDEMGLGKTLEILAFLKTIQGNGISLIVCPSSLTYNWANEIEKFFPNELSYIIIDGTKEQRSRKRNEIANYDIVITSYNLAHLDIEDYSEINFNHCILDEAQHIKNKSAKRTRSIKGIRSRNRIAITGTPLENNITELWSIFDFLMPGFLGTHQWFKKTYENPITGFNREERNIALKKLKTMISPFVIRRTKEVVYKELPPKIEQTIYIELNEKQKALYLETLSRVKNHYFSVVEEKGFEASYIEFLSALTRLRQICLHPALANAELLRENDDEELSVKLSALIELIEESIDSGHRVLVFSQFVQMLKIIRKVFHENEIEYLYIDGRTKDRVGLVNHFNDSDIPVFLISLRAGGTGLNLVGADSVIIFDPWWNPAVESQAVDRAHRIGQTDIVNVYRLVTRGTIEEKILKLQEQKRNIFDSVLEKDGNHLKQMSLEEIRQIFEIDEKTLYKY